MTDVELLSGTIAAKVRGARDVVRIYPVMGSTQQADRSASGLLAAIAADQSVVTRLESGVTVVEVSIGVSSAARAPHTARAVADLIGDTLRSASVDPYRLIVRVASIDR